MHQWSSKNPNSNALRNIPTYRAGVAQSAAYRSLRRLTEAAMKPYGISMMQWFIIGTIYEAGPQGISVSALSKLLGTNIPYITTSLQTLESKDIITRVETKDGRQKRVIIKPSYEPRIQQIEDDLRNTLRNSLYSSIDPAELTVYVKVLFQLQNTTLEI